MVFSKTRPIKNCGIHVFLGIKTWNTMVLFIETGILASPTSPISMKPPRNSSLPKKYVKPPILINRVSLKPSQTKTKRAVSLLIPDCNFRYRTELSAITKISHSKKIGWASQSLKNYSNKILKSGLNFLNWAVFCCKIKDSVSIHISNFNTKLIIRKRFT